jgi:transcriptional regulator with XRE-family HTH domain
MTTVLHRQMRRRLPLLDVPDAAPADIERPRTRGECADVPRPCPWASCRHSLLVDIDAHGHAHEVTLPETSTACALDIADGGESTLEDIAELAGVTRERIRQIEAKAFDVIRGRRSGKVLAELADDGRTIDKGRSAGQSRSFEERQESPEPAAERRREDDDYTAGMKVSFFAEGDGADELVSDMVWRLFAKDSTARGFDARSAASKRQSKWRKNNPARGPQFVAVPKKKAKAIT